MRSLVPFALLTLLCAACSAQAAPATSPAATTAVPSSTAAATAAAAGPLPVPFGPAANGLIFYSTTDNDIASVDPATGSSQVVLGGAPADQVPSVSPDGTRLLFDRSVNGPPGVWVAGIDGTGAREVLHRAPTWVDWAPDSHRIVTIPSSGGMTIVDVATGSSTTVDLPKPVVKASWLADGRLLVSTAATPGDPDADAEFATVNEDGSGYTVLPIVDGREEWSLSGDRSTFAYMSWGTEPGGEGLIHVFDLATGKDTLLAPPDPGYAREEPVFSPDGRWVAIDRHDATDHPLQTALLPADGSGDEVLLGERQLSEEGTYAQWSPDGSELLVTYPATGETWRFDVAARTGARVAWPDLGAGIGWQRVAP